MLILLYYISPVKIFWCVKYYKAQPYNMEHTLCVCNDENSNVKYGYCLKCSKFISRDSSNISKHQNSLHKTFVENLEEINNKIMIVFSWWKCLWYIGQVIITMYMCNWCV